MGADYDLCVIGGGINGVGIAREAAGRGLSVLLVEAQDLAQGTSSASTKLIHGGLRYLEQYNFKLVRHSLKEREVLLKAAPHIIRPLEFVLPYVEHLRPRWMIAAGLFLYDHLAWRKKLSGSSAVSLKDTLIGEPLKEDFVDGFRYSDCWADDARLVVLNAMDAKARGAEIVTRTACMQIFRSDRPGRWYVQLKDLKSGDEFQISAKMVVNAAGPWVHSILQTSDLVNRDTPTLRLIKGSHLIVPRLYEGDHAYILQQPDKRIVFLIPYEEKYTLIGTTDEEFEGDPSKPIISDKERQYLCNAASRFLERPIKPSDAPWSYSGVRALYDDGENKSQNITRDYKLHMETTFGPPLLSVFGGKLTTYRVLAMQAVDKITGNKRNRNWTAKAPLPGGDIKNGDMKAFIETKKAEYNFLPEDVVVRYANAYGTRMDVLLDGVTTLKGMGRSFEGVLFEKEILYLINHEFAKSADDILWRRSKLGLHLEKKTILALEAAMPDYLKAAGL
jgi:glycerol-3-phosphate dehydrogenase